MMSANPDIILIGGGLIGLSLAVELKLRGATVTVLSRDVQEAAGYVADPVRLCFAQTHCSARDLSAGSDSDQL